MFYTYGESFADFYFLTHQGQPNQEGVPRHRNGEPYDSSVDSYIKPELFIVHNKLNCYPRYLVTYTAKDVR